MCGFKNTATRLWLLQVKKKKKSVTVFEKDDLFLSRLIMLPLPKTILHLLSLSAHSYPHWRGLCLEIDMLTVKARTICEEHNFCHSCWRLALNWVSHKRQNSNVITLFKIYKRYGMCKRTFQKPQLHHLDLGFFFFFFNYLFICCSRIVAGQQLSLNTSDHLTLGFSSMKIWRPLNTCNIKRYQKLNNSCKQRQHEKELYLS